MKLILFVLVLVFMVGTTNAVQPARKPFIKIKVDGTTVKTGDILTVTNGQKLKLEVNLEGGRKDYCKFPDAYADIAGTAQILSRGENGITYILNDKKSEWKLINETYQFSSDEFVSINSSNNQPTADLSISDKKFAQSFVRILIKADWQFSEGEVTMHEENSAESIVYFKIAGSSDIWFQSQNIKVAGVKDDSIQNKLISVQAACDSIEKNLSLLKFSVVQQNIRSLQASVNELKSAIDIVKDHNSAFKIKVTFSGLPSDRPVKDIASFAAVKNSWSTLEAFLNEEKQALEKLSTESTSDNTKELARIISSYTDWQAKLPENSIGLINKYIPDIHTDSIAAPEKIQSFAKAENNGDYTQTLKDFNGFIDNRMKQATVEIQKITSSSSKIQAFRLFDGMLRSYFNSISWAEWINIRE